MQKARIMTAHKNYYAAIDILVEEQTRQLQLKTATEEQMTRSRIMTDEELLKPLLEVLRSHPDIEASECRPFTFYARQLSPLDVAIVLYVSGRAVGSPRVHLRLYEQGLSSIHTAPELTVLAKDVAELIPDTIKQCARLLVVTRIRQKARTTPSDPRKFRHLEEGEIVLATDEIYDDHKRAWVAPVLCVGKPAPNPCYTSHRQFRREIKPTDD